MMEAEVGFTRIIQCRPIVACSFQQGVGADDVGLDEFRRPRDRAINVGLCGQVHDGIRLMFTQDTVHLITVANVDAFEHITRVLADFGQ
ncbi:hypothetical protein D3C81_1900970 [compost metagenome]